MIFKQKNISEIIKNIYNSNLKDKYVLLSVFNKKPHLFNEFINAITAFRGYPFYVDYVNVDFTFKYLFNARSRIINLDNDQAHYLFFMMDALDLDYSNIIVSDYPDPKLYMMHKLYDTKKEKEKIHDLNEIHNGIYSSYGIFSYY